MITKQASHNYAEALVGEEEQTVDFAALAERLDKTLHSVEYPPELKSGQVIDVEVVNDSQQ
ncbi:hypothetical protein [Streptomyces phaeochromogenes]|uniref:hypothetical protein n=1 Tax=Streptomyces phaeochromogenes TaxID=1923 RepID=UPI003694C2AB